MKSKKFNLFLCEEQHLTESKHRINDVKKYNA